MGVYTLACKTKHWNNFKIISKWFYFTCNHGTRPLTVCHHICSLPTVQTSILESHTRRLYQKPVRDVDELKKRLTKTRSEIPQSVIDQVTDHLNRGSLSCLENIPELFQNPPKRFFHDALYFTSAAEHIVHGVNGHPRPTHLTKNLRCNTRLHYICNAKYFEIHYHFVSVSQNPKPATCMLVNFYHN